MNLQLAIIGTAAAASVLIGGGLYIDHLRDDRDAWKLRAEAAEGALILTARAKLDEGKAARADYEELAKTCTADFASAISRGRIIERVVSAPAPAAGAPRAIVGPSELQHIIDGRSVVVGGG